MGEQQGWFNVKDVFLFVVVIGLFLPVFVGMISGVSFGIKNHDWKPLIKTTVEPLFVSDKSLSDLQTKLDNDNVVKKSGGQGYDLLERKSLESARLSSFFFLFAVGLLIFWGFSFLFGLVNDGEQNHFLSLITTILFIAIVEFVYVKMVYQQWQVPLLGLWLFLKSSVLSIISFFGVGIG